MNRALFSVVCAGLVLSTTVLTACSLGQPRVDRGPGETWIVADANDAQDIKQSTELVQEQRGWGWASHLAIASQDGSLSQYAIGPVIYSKRGQRAIQIQYALMSSDVREGLLTVRAVGIDGSSRDWDDEYVFKVTLDEPLKTGYVTVPILGRASDGVWITWESTRYDWNNR
ncbi:MAG: hypothetical protein AB8C13_09690 [Phycisphaerales bacterium]